MRFKIEFEMDIPESVATEQQAIEFFKYKLGSVGCTQSTVLTDDWDLSAKGLHIRRVA
jgi:hypothetical protein